MKGSYQVVIAVNDVEDALEVAKLLASLEGLEKVKVGSISPRPEPRPPQSQQQPPVVKQVGSTTVQHGAR